MRVPPGFFGILFLIALSTTAGAGFFGRAGDGARGPTVLTLAPSARAVALGEAVAASEGGTAESFANPALLWAVSQPEVFLSRTSYGSAQSLTTVAAARPVWKGERRVWSAALSILQTQPFDVVVEDVSQGSVRPWEGVAAWSYARPIGKLTAGGTLKGVRQDLGGDAAHTVAGDLGLAGAFAEGRMGWGLALLNLGPSLDWGGRSTALPTVLKMGVRRRFQRGFAAAQLDWPTGRNLIGRAGAEWDLVTDRRVELRLRAGWETTERASVSRWIPSLGWGLATGRWRLNYAFTYREESRAFHRLDFGFRVGTMLSEETAREEALRGIRASMEANRWMAARDEVRRLQTDSPRDAVLHGLAAEVERGLLDSLDPATLLTRAQESVATGDLSAATDAYQKLLVVDPRNAEATAGLARVERERAAAQAARARAAVESTRRRALTQAMEAARRAMSDERWGDARSAWERVRAVDPDNSEAAAGRERCRRELRARAARDYAAGMAAYADRRLEEAVRLFEQAWEADPEDKNVRRSLERAREELKRR